MLTCVYSFCQQTKEGSDDYVNNMTGNLYKNGMWLPAKKLNKEIEGTTYLFKNWDGLYQLNYSNNKHLKLVNLNYNITTKTIESKISNDSVFQFQMNDIVSLKMVMIYTRYLMVNCLNKYLLGRKIVYSKILKLM